MTERKYIINQLLTKIEVSLLNQKKELAFLFSLLWKNKKLKNDRKIKINKKIKINNPLSGSLAKVWTEFKIPDLTKKVPVILKVNVEIDNINVHNFNICLFSKTIIVCKSAVKQSHGISDTFSTGSQNQNPPQPSS